LFTFAYSSSFILALTELVVSALSGRLYCQSQLQHSNDQDIGLTMNHPTTTNNKSIYAEVRIDTIIMKKTNSLIVQP
jgi:hypothetical protein